jgi:uncharacterized caspase-like protein
MKSKILWGSIATLVISLVGCNQTNVKSVFQSPDKGIRPLPVAVVEESKERRVALVIGNADYAHATRLNSPVNDAQDIDEALRDLGFDVIRPYYNLSKEEMRKAITEFSQQVRKEDVAFFFFSGHGVQVGGNNYLIPVEASINTDELDGKKLQTDIELHTVAEKEVTAAMSKAKVSFVALDSCRTDVLPAGKKSLNSGNSPLKALSPTLSSANYGETVIFYAAKDGTPAYDGKGRNSLFTKHLVKNLKQKNLTVNQLIQQVGKGVRTESNDEQKPYVYGSTEDICFAHSCTSNEPPSPAATPSSQIPLIPQPLWTSPPPPI